MIKVRALSFTLALMQLFSFGKFAIKKNNTLDRIIPKSSIEIATTTSLPLTENNIYKIKNKDGEILYFRLDSNGEYKNISIFDDENVPSKQYGATQIDFKNRFEEIINEPLIWDEIQKHFPIHEFNSEKEAMFFYERYLYIIYECGCGYAAAANYVFSLYEGREKEFEKAFGYPMYIVNEDGYVDFNYEVFMLKFFNYSVIERGEDKDAICNIIAKDLYAMRLNEYINSEEYKRKLPDDFNTWGEKEWEEWHKFDDERNQKFNELYQKYMETKNNYTNLGVFPDAAFGGLYSYLQFHGINNISTSCIDEPRKLETNDIVASDNFTLYKISARNIKYDINEYIALHYVYVVKVTEDNKIIVSSWGDKYVFEKNNDAETTNVLIKINN